MTVKYLPYLVEPVKCRIPSIGLRRVVVRALTTASAELCLYMYGKVAKAITNKINKPKLTRNILLFNICVPIEIFRLSL